MKYPKELKYSKEHEWVRLEGDVGVVGITEYAQHALGDIVFVEMPKDGAEVERMKAVAVVESVKSVSDVYAPVGGKIVEVNKKVVEKPDLVNSSPYGDGWMFKIRLRDKGDLSKLMDSEKYAEYIADSKR